MILLKRGTPSVGDILPEESAEFPKVIKWYEELCIKKFGAIKFNYIIMMMHDPFVHYHAFPRYDKKIHLFGLEWEDKNTLNNFASTETLNEKTLLDISENDKIKVTKKGKIKITKIGYFFDIEK